MAVSGRKLPDLSGSISIGSAEDFDHSCDPCLTAGQHIEAHGFCVDCKEYLCKSCFTYHQRTKASKHHQLLDRNTIDKQGIPKTNSDVCIEICNIHKDKVIKYFCHQHEELGCHDCMTLNHKTCMLDYIPDNCADIGDSSEYRRTIWLFNQKMKEINAVEKSATKRGKEIDTCHENLIKDMDKFQKEIIDRIQQIRRKIQAEVDKKKSTDKKIIQGVIDTCTQISSDICHLQSSLKDKKTTKQNGDLYTAIKRSISKLKSDEFNTSEEGLKKTNLQYRFQYNQDLQKMFSKPNAFGNLSLYASLVTPCKKLDTLIHKEDININSKSDKHSCWITGCAVLSADKLVLADYDNYKLKVVDTQSKCVVEEKQLDSEPFGITTLPHDQVAVTLPDKRQILVLTSDSKLSTVNKFPVTGCCGGITYHQDHLYTVCKDPTNVVILDTKGNVYNTIPLNNDIFKKPTYIVVSEDSRLIYISERSSKSIHAVSITSGELSAVYKDLPSPHGILMLDDGSLLVCCYNGTIHHVSGDLKQGQEMIDGLLRPYSICYNHHQHEVYIGIFVNDQLKVLSLK